LCALTLCVLSLHKYRNEKVSILCYSFVRHYFLSYEPLLATHNRAGEISYHFSGSNTITATLITYTKVSSVAADRDSISFHWGDGTPDQIFYRTNGPLNSSNFHNGEIVAADYKKNTYTGTHHYTQTPPAGFTVISFADPNRTSSIINMANSVGTPFYIEDTVWFRNMSDNFGPILLYPPLDMAIVGDTFFHNPAAYDVEADSLTFDLVTPLQGSGQDVSGYISPSVSAFGRLSTLTIDRDNGEIIWASPSAQGVYDIAIRICEYRDGQILSTMIRDMQIIVVSDTAIHAPLNGRFADTTIAPLQSFAFVCHSNDTVATHVDTLSAYGGPFVFMPDSASFPMVSGNPISGTMTWTPGPNRYKARETRIVAFRSQTNTTIPVSTIRAFRITVADTLFSGLATMHNTTDNERIRVYPNPVSGQGQIFVNSITAGSVSISDAMGRLLYEVAVSAGQNSITLRLPEGLFFYKAVLTNGESQTGQISVTR